MADDSGQLNACGNTFASAVAAVVVVAVVRNHLNFAEKSTLDDASAIVCVSPD